jgi:8-oxo-dGTP diphosphatase
VDLLRSSPYTRCIETLEPLAALTGLEIETADHLAEGADPRETLELISSTAGLNVALSSHGDLIPDVISELGRIGAEIRSSGGRPDHAKGSVWEISVYRKTVKSALWIPPPA